MKSLFSENDYEIILSNISWINIKELNRCSKTLKLVYFFINPFILLGIF